MRDLDRVALVEHPEAIKSRAKAPTRPSVPQMADGNRVNILAELRLNGREHTVRGHGQAGQPTQFDEGLGLTAPGSPWIPLRRVRGRQNHINKQRRQIGHQWIETRHRIPLFGWVVGGRGSGVASSERGARTIDQSSWWTA